jgi:hypothetical protein
VYAIRCLWSNFESGSDERELEWMVRLGMTALEALRKVGFVMKAGTIYRRAN